MQQSVLCVTPRADHMPAYDEWIRRRQQQQLLADVQNPSHTAGRSQR